MSLPKFIWTYLANHILNKILDFLDTKYFVFYNPDLYLMLKIPLFQQYNRLSKETIYAFQIGALNLIQINVQLILLKNQI